MAQYSKEIQDEIIARICGGESVNSILKDKHMPSGDTFYKWIKQREDFRAAYVEAKEVCAERYAEEIISIADNDANQPLIVDGAIVYDKNGKPVRVVDNASVQHAKLRVEARKWIASKLKPKKYGTDTVDHTHKGEVTIKVVTGIDAAPGSQTT